MSQLLFSDVKFLQRFLHFGGFNPGAIDGQAGAKTMAAQQQFFDRTAAIKAELGAFDSRSEANIALLIPQAQRMARRLLSAAIAHGHTAKVISGMRTYAEQAELYAQGRSKPGNIVTNARPGQSYHNFGMAVDLGLFNGTTYIKSDAPYVALGPVLLAAVPGVEWGGNWRKKKDNPHYQLASAHGIDDLRRRFLAGLPFE